MIKAIDLEIDVRETTDVLEENQRLKAVLSDVIEGLDVLENQVPAESMAALRGQIHTAIRQQIDHFCACLGDAGLQGKM